MEKTKNEKGVESKYSGYISTIGNTSISAQSWDDGISSTTWPWYGGYWYNSGCQGECKATKTVEWLKGYLEAKRGKKLKKKDIELILEILEDV